MLPIGLNHMTAPRHSVRGLFELAKQLGCAGVELRNDLGVDLFEGQDPGAIRAMAQSHNLRILALAEVKAFNEPSPDLQTRTLELIENANACGAEGVALIPKVADVEIPRDQQRAALKLSLELLQPLLEDNTQIGLIEPLGFETSSLRYKDDVVAVLDDMNRPRCFRLIHDTFHHHLAETDGIHAELTDLVHISGVSNPSPKIAQMTDAHRVLVDTHDRLENIQQLMALKRDGFRGLASFEAFAPEIHQLKDPFAALAGSIDFIANQMVAEPA